MSRFKAALIVTSIGLTAAFVQRPQLLSGQEPPVLQSVVLAQTGAPTVADVSKMPLVNITIVQIRPELANEWLEFQKSDTIPTLKKAGVTQRSAFATVIGPSFEYALLTPAANLAERDGDNPIVKALGQDGARAYAQKSRRFIASQRTSVVRLRTDLTYRPDPNAQLPIVVVSAYSIAAGHAADFENYIKTDLIPAHKQLTTGGLAVYQGLFGGDGSEFIVATLARDFAELDKGPAMRLAYGAERAAAIQKKLAGIVAHVERTVVRAMPELTFQVAARTEDR
jgi:hypothetical protein